MRILIYLCFLILVPIIVGTGLILAGYSAGSFVLALGIPAVMIILVMVGLIIMMKGKLFKSTSDNDDSDSIEPSQKEQEQAAIDAVNSSAFNTNKFNLAEYEANHIIEATKHVSKKGFAMGILFFVLLVADAVVATVLTINRIWIGAIVCASIFGATVIIGLLAAVIKQKIFMSNDISKAKKIVDAKIEFCVMSDMTTSKSVNSSVRIDNVVYRVGVHTNDGEYEALSKRFYEIGETVKIAVMNKKRAKILDEVDLIKQNENNSNVSDIEHDTAK